MSLDILEEMRQGYLHSFPAHLNDMEAQILSLEKDVDFKENFDALYRKVHSLKGSGGTYGFTIISSICHQLEDFLTDEVDGGTNIDQSKINVIFSHVDILKDAYDLLVEKKTNFTEIEKALHKLKQQGSESALRVLIIGSLKNMYGQICAQVLSDRNVSYTATDTISAIQRLQHEPFDLLITSQENKVLNGTSLIAAIKLSKQNRGMKYILLTSNSNIDVPVELKPEYIIEKKADFANILAHTIEKIISEA